MIRLITNTLEPISYLLFLLFFLIYAVKEHSKRIWAFIIYYLLSFFLMLIATQRVFSNTNNIEVYNLHLLFTSIIYCYYFYHLLQIKSKKIVFYTTAILFTLYYIVKNLILKDNTAFDSFGYSGISAFILVCVFLFFKKELNRFDGNEIFLRFDFWYLSSLILYYLGAFIIFLSYYFLTSKISGSYSDKQRDILTLLWGLHNILLFLSSLVTISGTLWVTYRRK